MKNILNFAMGVFFWTTSISYSQNFPEKKLKLLESPDDVVIAIQSAADGKNDILEKGELLMLQTQLSAFGDRIKYIGNNAHGAYMSADVLPASPKYWLTPSPINLNHLRGKMTLGELLDIFKVKGGDPWHLVSEDFGRNALSESIGQVMRLTFRVSSIKDGFISFSVVAATVVPEAENLKNSVVIVHAVASVKLNTLGFADLSPYSF